MANFCPKCGKELLEGQVCDCQATVAQTTTSTNQSSGFDAAECGKDCLGAVTGVFTKPVDTIKGFVSDNKFISGIFLIVITALLSGLSRVIVLAHAFDKVKAYSSVKPKYFDEFFEVFATNLVKYAAIAFLAYLVVTIILKGKATWKETLNATALSLIVSAFAIVIATILTFFEGDLVAYVASYVSTFASVFSIAIFFEAIKEKAGIDTNKLFISCASVFVGAEIVVDIVNKLFS